MLRRLLLALLVAGSVVTACSGSGGQSTRYPRKRPGCELAVYHGLPNGAWDDIGPVEVGCYLDEADSICLSRLRAEACYKGGNILYNVPRKALRPLERAKVFRAMVAHTREGTKTADDEPAPSEGDAGTGSGPIVPLPRSEGVTPLPAAPADAGTQ
jgi:hypothetical protein